MPQPWKPPDTDKTWTPPDSDKTVGPSFLPSGTAQPNPAGPESPNNVTPGQIAGMGSNILNNAMAGGGLGSFFGPVGTGIGVGAGALASLFQRPSETPGMDTGAALGSLAASAIPGGRVARALGQVAGTTLGAIGGSQADKALGFTKDTDYGKVGIYGAGSTVAGILGSLASEASPAMQAAQRLQGSTGVNYPLNVSEATGRFGGLTDFFSTGSRTAQDLAAAQSQAAQSAFAKIVGSPIENDVNAIMEATKGQSGIRKDIIRQFATNYKNANAQTVTTQVPNPDYYNFTNGESKPFIDVTRTTRPTKVDWNDFQKMYGLSDQERDMFFKAVQASPEQYVNQLVPTGSNPVKGLLKLRGLMSVLEGSGNTSGAAKLGTAFAMRDLGPALNQDVVNGKTLADAIDRSADHFKVVFNPKQQQALQDLATVARNASPLEKAAGQSQAAHSSSYLMNKILFGAASMTAVAGAGAEHAGLGSAGVWLLGTAGGATAALSTSVLMGKILANPGLGKLLIRASDGDQKAMSAAVRVLTTDRYSASDQPDTPTPASRLQGLFQK